MKEIFEVRANQILNVKQTETDFQLVPAIELIIIHTDGKEYKSVGDKLRIEPKVSETRFVVPSDAFLDTLIAQLQLHQRNFKSLVSNSAVLNEIAKNIIKTENEK